MGIEIKTQYKPSLIEASAGDMQDIFERKIKDKGAESLVDYIGLSDELLKDRIARLKVAKADIDIMMKAATGQQLIIKEQAAVFLADNGIDRLDGDRISSLTTTTPAPSKKVIIEDEQLLRQNGYEIISLDKKAVTDDLKAGEKIPGATLEVIVNADSIKINRRKTV